MYSRCLMLSSSRVPANCKPGMKSEVYNCLFHMKLTNRVQPWSSYVISMAQWQMFGMTLCDRCDTVTCVWYNTMTIVWCDTMWQVWHCDRCDVWHDDNCVVWHYVTGVWYDTMWHCDRCDTCKKTHNQHLLVKCDNCCQYQHLSCLDPPLLRMPKKTKLQGW